MFLSIIIPTYNDEKYLDECLSSCLTQDISVDDYEIICVDDGSTDRTPQMLDEYAAKYSNITVIHKEHGVGYGRNIGLDHAKGDYIWFVDHDDLIEENCLNYLKKQTEETGCERLEFPYYDIWGSFSEDELFQMKNGHLKPETKLIRLAVWTSITKRSFLLQNNIYPHSLRLKNRIASYGVDCLYVKECMKANPITFTIEDRPFYYYRHYQSQSMLDYSESAMKLRINSYISFALMYKEEYEEMLSNDPEHCFDAAMEYVVSVRGCIMEIDLLSGKYRKIAKRMLKESGVLPFNYPKVYSDNYSCWDCAKSNNGMNPIVSIAFYYICHPAGFFFYKLLNIHCWTKKLASNKLIRIARAKILSSK